MQEVIHAICIDADRSAFRRRFDRVCATIITFDRSRDVILIIRKSVTTVRLMKPVESHWRTDLNVRRGHVTQETLWSSSPSGRLPARTVTRVPRRDQLRRLLTRHGRGRWSRIFS